MAQIHAVWVLGLKLLLQQPQETRIIVIHIGVHYIGSLGMLHFFFLLLLKEILDRETDIRHHMSCRLGK